jgi:hypothetical protein
MTYEGLSAGRFDMNLKSTDSTVIAPPSTAIPVKKPKRKGSWRWLLSRDESTDENTVSGQGQTISGLSQPVLMVDLPIPKDGALTPAQSPLALAQSKRDGTITNWLEITESADDFMHSLFGSQEYPTQFIGDPATAKAMDVTNYNISDLGDLYDKFTITIKKTEESSLNAEQLAKNASAVSEEAALARLKYEKQKNFFGYLGNCASAFIGAGLVVGKWALPWLGAVLSSPIFLPVVGGIAVSFVAYEIYRMCTGQQTMTMTAVNYVAEVMDFSLETKCIEKEREAQDWQSYAKVQSDMVGGLSQQASVIAGLISTKIGIINVMFQLVAAFITARDARTIASNISGR